jgi:hypothetical protein
MLVELRMTVRAPNRGSFSPGNSAASGNAAPVIRRNRRYLSLSLAAQLDEIERSQNISNLHRIVRELVRKACNGDLGAIKLIFDRLEGTPLQTVAMNVSQRYPVIDDGEPTTPAQAARAYQQMLNAADADDDDIVH